MRILGSLVLTFVSLVLIVPSDRSVGGEVKKAAQEHKKKELDPDVAELVRGNNEFAFDLYRQLAKKEGNIVFSPYSISTALAMTYAGARGETAAEMAKTLQFTLAPERLHKAYGKLTRQVEGRDEEKRPFELHVANALWGQRGYPFNRQYLDIVNSDYSGRLREVDFQRESDASRRKINRWVEEQTNEKIRDLLQPGDVNEKTRALVTNAIYFIGTWKNVFSKDQTKDSDFEILPGRNVAVPMMCLRDQYFRYFPGNDFELLEMPYRAERFSMWLILPKKRNALPQLEESLSTARLNDAISKRRMQMVHVTLPRFTAVAELRLRSELTVMGMRLAFTQNADFSGIGGHEKLNIDQAIHKADIIVNEQGTEAAAATSVGIKALSGPKEYSVRFDHPFMYFVRDNDTDTILFLGRCADPRR